MRSAHYSIGNRRGFCQDFRERTRDSPQEKLMQVPFLDIKAHNRSIWSDIQASLEPVLAEAQFVLGPAVERFEKHFAKYVGTKHCVGLNNGTSALQMALIATD